MLIEVSESLKVRLPDRELDLTPGTQIELEDRYAVKLIERLGGMAKVVIPKSDRSSLQSGDLVSWKSPLFGRCYGRIAIIHDEYEWMLVADHSVLNGFAFVSKKWAVSEVED